MAQYILDLFGRPIPIRAVAGDQQAALFGCHLNFKSGVFFKDLKLKSGVL